MPERRTHDYVRHGVTSLFAAFSIADGTVISSLHRRHRAIEFKKFLTKIDTEVPDDLDVHLSLYLGWLPGQRCNSCGRERGSHVPQRVSSRLLSSFGRV